MFRTGICSAGEHRAPCPDRFGRRYARLVSNLVGLDNHLTLEGNEPVERTQFLRSSKKSYSEKAATNSKERNTKGMPEKGNKVSDLRDCTTNQERRAAVTENQLNMAKGIDDLRVRKASRKAFSMHSPAPVVQKNTVTPSPTTTLPDKCNSCKPDVTHLNPSGAKNHPSQTLSEENESKSRKMWKLHESGVSGMGTRFSYSGETRNYDSRQKHQDVTRNRCNSASWQEKKCKQQQLQVGGFQTPKQNPFSTFKFDPNDAESNLDALSQASHKVEDESRSRSIFLMQTGRFRPKRGSRLV